MSVDNRDENTSRLLYEQLEVMKKQLRLSRIVTGIVSAAAVILIVLAAVAAVPAVQAVNHAERVLSELDESDIEKIAEGMDGLKEIGQAADKLGQVDLDRLNEAIQNLEGATRPLAQLFGNKN